MSTNLETFYGFKLGVAKEISSTSYAPLKKELGSLIKSLETKTGHHFSAYLSVCQFLIKKETLLGVGPLSQRLEKLSLKWSVNPEEQKKGTLLFLNHLLPSEKVLLDPPVSHHFEKFHLSCELSGRYVQDSDSFRLLIAAAIDDLVQPRRRNVMLSSVAIPTTSYQGTFVNVDGRTGTKITYHLTRSVQFLLDL